MCILYTTTSTITIPNSPLWKIVTRSFTTFNRKENTPLQKIYLFNKEIFKIQPFELQSLALLFPFLASRNTTLVVRTTFFLAITKKAKSNIVIDLL